MKLATLPNGVDTTALGFGCAYLAGGAETRRNLQLVAAAIDSGIRHYDVAPAYGAGGAEDVLGRALRGRRHAVTVATKAGLPRPPAPSRTGSALRALARPLRNAGRRFRPRKADPAAARPRGQFDAAYISDSVHDSLRRLQTDYVDVLLLHEVTPGDISEELLKLLQQLRSHGTCRAIGLATEPENIRTIAAIWPDIFDVHQCRWSVLDRQAMPAGSPLLITHRALFRAYQPLRRWLEADRAACRRLQTATGRDLHQPKVLSQVLLGAAIGANPGGIVLMASHRIDRIEENARVCADEQIISAGSSLRLALLQEPQCPAPP